MWARWPYSCSIASATDATSTSRNPSTSGSAAGCAALHRLHTKSAEITATTDHNNLVFMVGCGDYSSDTVYYRLGQVARRFLNTSRPALPQGSTAAIFREQDSRGLRF